MSLNRIWDQNSKTHTAWEYVVKAIYSSEALSTNRHAGVFSTTKTTSQYTKAAKAFGIARPAGNSSAVAANKLCTVWHALQAAGFWRKSVAAHQSHCTVAVASNMRIFLAFELSLFNSGAFEIVQVSEWFLPELEVGSTVWLFSHSLALQPQNKCGCMSYCSSTSGVTSICMFEKITSFENPHHIQRGWRTGMGWTDRCTCKYDDLFVFEWILFDFESI